MRSTWPSWGSRLSRSTCGPGSSASRGSRTLAPGRSGRGSRSGDTLRLFRLLVVPEDLAVAELGVLDLLVVPELLAVVALLAMPEVRVEVRLLGGLDVLEVVELLAIVRSISVIFGL